jgi:hypothetical protein
MAITAYLAFELNFTQILQNLHSSSKKAMLHLITDRVFLLEKTKVYMDRNNYSD